MIDTTWLVSRQLFDAVSTCNNLGVLTRVERSGADAEFVHHFPDGPWYGVYLSVKGTVVTAARSSHPPVLRDLPDADRSLRHLLADDTYSLHEILNGKPETPYVLQAEGRLYLVSPTGATITPHIAVGIRSRHVHPGASIAGLDIGNPVLPR